MEQFFDIMQSFTPIIVALIGGGVAVKILDYFMNRSGNVEKVKFSERENLRSDLKALREEVKELRNEVSELRTVLAKKIELISILTTRWFALRTVVMSLVSYIEHTALNDTDEELDRLVFRTKQLIKEEDEDL